MYQQDGLSKGSKGMLVGLNLLFLVPNIVGGTETHALSLLRALAKVSDPRQYWLFINKETYTSGLVGEGGWHIVPSPVPARHRPVRYAWEQFVLPIQAKKLRLDLVHSLGYVQPLRLPCKSVVTIHDLNFYNIGHLMSWTRRAGLRYFVTRSAETADHIITVSEFSKGQIIELLGVPPEKVTVIYNAVNERLVAPAGPDELERDYGITRPYILGLSSPSPHKNIVGLVKAFEHLKRNGYKELRLVLAGHRPADKGKLDRTIRDSGLGNEILFTGYVPDRILAGLYAHAEAFVFPSTYEGFGIPILEAFSLGTPVVCSRAAAIPEVAGDAACYFDPFDPEDMASVISSVLSDTELRKRMVDRGKLRVRLFSWEKTAEQTLAVYQKVLER